MEEEAGGGGGGGSEKPPKSGFTPEYVHDLREENKSWRLKHAEAEAARKTEADARKAAEEKAAGAEKASGDKIKEVQTTADQRLIRAELKASALKAGMVDMDFLKLADISGLKLKEDGEVEGADELMAALKKSKPHWFGDPSTSHGGKPPRKGADTPKLATEMTDEEYAAAKRKAIKA